MLKIQEPFNIVIITITKYCKFNGFCQNCEWSIMSHPLFTMSIESTNIDERIQVMSNSHKNTRISNLETQIQKNNARTKRNMRKNRELLDAVHKLEDQLAALTPSTGPESEEIRPVRLHMLLDRSGSMAGYAEDVIGGFNAFVDK